MSVRGQPLSTLPTAACTPRSNFITDKPSSRVLAPPGGHTSWSLSGDGPTDVIKARVRGRRADWGASELPASSPASLAEALSAAIALSCPEERAPGQTAL